MLDNTESYLSQLNKNNAVRSNIRQVIVALSLIVVLGVFWGLKLTGITMAGEAFCGKAEHVHGEECPVKNLICAQEEQEAHVHDESCIFRELLCELEEAEPHTHSDDCRERILTCTRAEVEGHTHGEDCLIRTLTCLREETQGHTHGITCYHREPVCGIEEDPGHWHDEDCYSCSIACGMEESEEHSHDDSCLEEELVCDLEEWDGHTHSGICMEETLVCTMEECEAHLHGDACYVTEEGFGCGLEEKESHFHGEACYTLVEDSFLCGLEETEGHTHTEECWHVGIGFGCAEKEADGHVHTDACLTEQTELSCGREATPGHTHGEECYDILEECPLEEHIHEENCYSDLSADLETPELWESAMEGFVRSSIISDNVITMARSQLGYTESTLNFQVDAEGIRRGITRYGQWYGNPYGDWSAMFVSFCLHYAGVEDLPANAGPEAMRLEWEKAGLYKPAGEYAPQVGDVLFLSLEKEAVLPAAEEPLETTEGTAPPEQTEPAEETGANAAAIITGFSDNVITVIQGDLEDAVAETTYSAEDPAVLGYGLVPTAYGAVPLAAPPASAVPIAVPTNYNTSQFTSANAFVVYTERNGNYYAFDGSGNAVQIYMDDSGMLVSDIANQNQLLWTITPSGNAYLIRNASTRRYMHTYANNGSGVTTTGEYTSSFIQSGGGVKVKSNNEFSRLNDAGTAFQMVRNESEATVYKLGLTNRCTVWLDGTGGGQGQLGGSTNESHSVLTGGTFRLPETWRMPEKYSQKLRGWYDVTNQKYYPPGAEVIINGNTVFYADWVAESYDVGVYNAYVEDTVSTKGFITAHVFDYNYLFNVMSANANKSVSASSHSETWSLVQSGKVDHNDQETLDFVFVDYDGSSRLPDMGNRDNGNKYLGVGEITQGLYTPELAEILFGTDNALNPQTGQGVIGKTYLGTGDHLFQFISDPSDPNYGYYYYDSQHNAASYNQSDRRFYVYEYLEATSDSLSSDNKSDFLPFNSPYANTNGKTVRTYTYDGLNGEYTGTTHYRYDAKYDDSNNDPQYVSTNYAFGVRLDVDFFLSNQPGQADADGTYGNRDVYGNEMHFRFRGDDDVWVLVDGVLILDIGGIHGIEGGDINFATGVVMVNGTVDQKLSAALKNIKAGEHNMTVMYLERGSSQSNCAFYFNVAPRFSLSIQKEDVLTQELLNGAQFTVYTDAACTNPAELWTSQASHDRDEPAQSTFTVENGVANMWGFASGNTYYIRETKPPDAEGYGFANGIIRLTIDKYGIATYDVEILDDGSNGVSNGFTVHGVKINEETQSAYIVATNAQDWVKDVTTVQVFKQWKDNLDHSDGYATVYLTVTDPDGTVRRIREVILSEENDWKYTWTNLPKYASDGVTPIQYGVDEAYQPGYQPRIQEVDEFSVVTETWAEAYSLQNGQTYVFRNGTGYLSTTGAGADTGFKWVTETDAKASPYALWTAHASGNAFRLTNGAGQTIFFYYANGSPTDFFASTASSVNNSANTFRTASANTGIRLYYDAPNGRDYYMTSSMNSSGKFGYNTSSRNGMILTPMTRIQTTHTEAVTGWGFQVENVPLEEETALTVNKKWVIPPDMSSTAYQTEQVTVRLFANGVDTGRTVTLNLKNNWVASFQGLPYAGEDDIPIVYTVEEIWKKDKWTSVCGEIITHSGDPPTYSVTVTNTYYEGGPELPSTGTAARVVYQLCGGTIMLLSLAYGIGSRRKRERRMK